MANQQPARPTTSDITITDLNAICEQVATVAQASLDKYEPTLKQLFFFALIWANKQVRGNLQKIRADDKPKQKLHFAIHQLEDRLPGLNHETAYRGVQAIASHLTDWGSQVYGLKQGNIKEWEALRIQLEKAIHRYRSSQEIKANAVQEAQIKVFEVLKLLLMPEDVEKLEVLKQEPNPEEVTETAIFSFFQKWQAKLSGVYDFSTPFYAYAKVIVRHKFFDILSSLEGPVPLPLHEFEEILIGEETPGEDEEARNVQLLQLRIDLANLLALIPSVLPPKPYQVVWATLARRKQFWLALEITELEPPIHLQRNLEDTSDASIANNLKISENTVTVHRALAKNRIKEHDPILGERLAVLMDPHLPNKL